jgi:hypothetical protein
MTIFSLWTGYCIELQAQVSWPVRKISFSLSTFHFQADKSGNAFLQHPTVTAAILIKEQNIRTHVNIL